MDPKNIKRVYSTMTVKAVDEDKREITGIASTPGTDRMGDVVVPAGAKFNLPIPLLWQHDHDQPIGQVTAAKITDKGIEIVASLAKIDAPSQLAARLEEAWQSIKGGLVRGLSIGFRPIKYAFLDDGGVEFAEWDWYELSAVTIPANAEASITSVKTFDTKQRASSGAERSRVVRLDNSPAGVSATKQTQPITLTPKEGKKMNLQEQIKSARMKRDEIKSDMDELLKKSVEAGETMSAEDDEQYETLKVELETVSKHIKRLEEHAKIDMESAKPVDSEDGKSFDGASASRGGSPIRVERNVAKNGIALAQMVKCIGRAQGNYFGALQIAESAGESLDPRVKNVLKAAVAAGSTSNSTWAGNLVGDETSVYADFIEYLRPMTVIGKFGTDGVPALRSVPFRTPLIGQTSGGAGYWVGEGQAKPLTKFDFSRTTLDPLKVANIAVVTKEVVANSSPSADAIIRDQLVAALRERLDLDFINPGKAAVVGVSPASITNGLTPISSTGDPEADVQALFAAFIAANLSPASGVFIMSSMTALALSMRKNPLGQREYPELSLTGGIFQGLPVIVTEYVPTDSSGSLLILANASDIYLGDEGGFAVDMSDQASLEMADNPAHNSGTPTPAQLVSLWQTNSVGFRAEREINWAKRRAQAVAYVSGVDYSAQVQS